VLMIFLLIGATLVIKDMPEDSPTLAPAA